MSDFVCPEGARLIPLGSRKHPGKYAIVDEYDFGWLSRYRWYYREVGTHQKCTYAMRSATSDDKARGKTGTLSMHREIMGDIGELHVDHINHNGLDNRRENLRAVTHAQNMQNRRPTRAPVSKSPASNVYLCRKREKPVWRAEIWISNKRALHIRSQDKATARHRKIEGEIVKSVVLELFR